MIFSFFTARLRTLPAIHDPYRTNIFPPIDQSARKWMPRFCPPPPPRCHCLLPPSPPGCPSAATGSGCRGIDPLNPRRGRDGTCSSRQCTPLFPSICLLLPAMVLCMAVLPSTGEEKGPKLLRNALRLWSTVRLIVFSGASKTIGRANRCPSLVPPPSSMTVESLQGQALMTEF
jgi:hypothetical protein